MMIAANAGQYQVLTGGAGLPSVSARPRSASAFSSATITVASAAVGAWSSGSAGAGAPNGLAGARLRARWRLARNWAVAYLRRADCTAHA